MLENIPRDKTKKTGGNGNVFLQNDTEKSMDRSSNQRGSHGNANKNKKNEKQINTYTQN